ncbi:MAG: RAMP superfamily CRISPR-associated protein [Candidatus Anstonellales archaeon]
MNKLIRIRLDVLSPTSIRSGEELDLIFSLTKKGNAYYLVDIKKLTALAKFEELEVVVDKILNGDIENARIFITKLFEKYGVLYNSKIELQNYPPQYNIEVKNPTKIYETVSLLPGLGYIPGSSFKGALIATYYFIKNKELNNSVLNEINRKFELERFGSKNREKEKRLFKKFEFNQQTGKLETKIRKDYILVRDMLPLNNNVNVFVSTEVNIRSNIKNKNKPPVGPEQMVEYLKPSTTFVGTMKKEKLIGGDLDDWLHGPEKMLYKEEFEHIYKELKKFNNIVIQRELKFWESVNIHDKKHGHFIKAVREDVISFWELMKNLNKPFLLMGRGKKAHTKLKEDDKIMGSRNITYYNGKFYPIGVVAVSID